MLRQKLLDSNRIWITIVLLHIAGSILNSLLGIFPFGRMIAATILWIYLAIMQKKNQRWIGICIAGWLITILTMYSFVGNYQGSILLDEILLLYVFFICQKAYMKPMEYCHIRKISMKSVIWIIIAAVFLFIMAGYVNICSMLAFQNLVDASLESIVDKPIEALITVAVMPAIVEEFLFRGMIYRGISNKRTAIIVSAILFALLHMNFNQMCYAFIMGLAFALIVYITDNLTISILLHMLFNTFTVISCCFIDKNVIQAILRFNIAGYSPFAPSLVDTQGHIQVSLLIIGAVIAIISAGIAAYAVLWIRKVEEKTRKTETIATSKNIKPEEMVRKKTEVVISNQQDRNIEENSGLNIKWRPNLQFFIGSGICILIAVLYEILL